MSDLIRSGEAGGVPQPGYPNGPGAMGPPNGPAPGYGGGDPPSDEIELREIFAILRRRLWLVVLFAVLGGAGAWFWAERQDPTFRASATVQIEDPREQLGSEVGGALLDRGGTTDPVRSQVEILRSRTVLGEIVDRQGLQLASLTPGLSGADLADVEVTDQAPPDTLEVRFNAQAAEVDGFGSQAEAPYGETLEVGPVRFAVAERPEELEEALLMVRDRQRAIERLADDLTTSRREETDVVDLELSTADPALSRDILNTAVEVFRDRSTEDARAESERRQLFLEEQLAQADSTLQLAQSALSDFRSREQVLSSREWFAAHQEGLLNIEMRTEELSADRSMYGELLDGLQEGEPGEMGQRLESLVASPEFAENPVVGSLFEQLVQYETARDSLTSGPWGASADNPDVAWAEQQIDRTQERLEGTVRSHMSALDARLEALDDLRNRTAGQIEGLPQAEAEESRLVQEVEAARTTAERLREEHQRAQMAAAVEEGPVRVVDQAALPLDPEGPGLPLYLVLGVMLGLMVGSGGAFLLETMNTRIRHQQDVEELLRVPNLTVVPRMTAAPAGARRLLAGVGGDDGDADDDVIEEEMAPELVTVRQDPSGSAEAFRTLRTNLLFTETGAQLSSLVITSPSPAEGKTSTAANLAVTYAQQGLKVLLVDADLRKGRLHEVFGLARRPGFTELVMGTALWEEVAHDAPVDGLEVVPTGSLPPNPVELLGGARVRRAIDLFREHFDVVLFDTPPLVAAPDASILGSLCDGVVLVVRSGSTENQAGEEAIRQLHTVGARVLGTVLNDPDSEVPKYSRYYGYQYKYYGVGE